MTILSGLIKWPPEETPENPFRAQTTPLIPEKDMWRCHMYQGPLNHPKGCSNHMVYKLMPNPTTPAVPWWFALRTAYLPRNKLARSTISRVPPATLNTLEKTANLLCSGCSPEKHHREVSPVGRHMCQMGHTIDWGGTKILDCKANWFRRGVKEAIHICRRHPDVNLDQGRHQLPHC